MQKMIKKIKIQQKNAEKKVKRVKIPENLYYFNQKLY